MIEPTGSATASPVDFGRTLHDLAVIAEAVEAVEETDLFDAGILDWTDEKRRAEVRALGALSAAIDLLEVLDPRQEEVEARIRAASARTRDARTAEAAAAAAIAAHRRSTAIAALESSRQELARLQQQPIPEEELDRFMHEHDLQITALDVQALEADVEAQTILGEFHAAHIDVGDLFEEGYRRLADRYGRMRVAAARKRRLANVWRSLRVATYTVAVFAMGEWIDETIQVKAAVGLAVGLGLLALDAFVTAPLLARYETRRRKDSLRERIDLASTIWARLEEIDAMTAAPRDAPPFAAS